MGITKGIILAAGYGTRFLPVTKSVPKELLPIGNRPALDLIIDEFVASGVRDVLIIISPHKRMIVDYYRPLRWLERFLKDSDRPDLLQCITPPPIRIRFIIQRAMRGTGHALLQARRFVGADSVVVAYPDDLHLGTIPLTKQLIVLYEATNSDSLNDVAAPNGSDAAFRPAPASLLAAVEISTGHERYGMLATDPRQRLVRGIVEKPATGQAPSNYASIGRFLLRPNFFTYLAEGWRRFDRRSQREYYHIYALERLIADQKLQYHIIAGKHIDIGSPDGYLAALNAYAAIRS